MNSTFILITLKKKLKEKRIGKILIKIYHYLIAVPVVWLGSVRFFFIRNKLRPVQFFSLDDTFDMLISHKVSLCRFGDGEISWIYKDSKGYFGQENSDELSIRLKEVFNGKEKNVLIGVPDFFGAMEQYSKSRVRSRNAHLAKYYKRWKEILDYDNIYADALITRLYNGKKNKDVGFLFEKWKNVWADKEVIIIEGSQTRFGVGNNLLENARSIRRIIAPSENAFGVYNKIWEITKKYITPEVIFLVALGPTASVLSYDIALCGGQAIDIGHLDVEYEWYLQRFSKKMSLPGKYVNEAGGSPETEIPEEQLNHYKKEIIQYID